MLLSQRVNISNILNNIFFEIRRIMLMGIMNQRYITYAEAQKLYSVGRSRLQRLVVTGIIEAFRPGKETLLDAVSVDRWFRSTKIKPVLRRGRPRKGTPRI